MTELSAPMLAALGRLNENQREALIDRVLLERSHQDIADTMGVSRSRVQQLEQDARRILSGLLGAA